jgi:PKD repeat protein
MLCLRVLLTLLLLSVSAVSSFAAIVAGPWLQAATTTQIVIMWESSDNTAGSVDYGATTSYGTNVASSRVTVAAAADGTGTDTAAILHTVVITGLTANTLYHYRVTSGATVDSDRTFRTHKTTGTWRIVHMSDAQYWLLGQTQQTRNSIIAYAPDYVIFSGDATDNSTNNQYRKYFQNDNGLFKSTVHYAVRGNHDNRTWSTFNSWFYNGQTGGADWGDCFSSDCENFYSFDIGPVHYVGINNNQNEASYPAGAIDWLTADLAASTAQWKMVFMKADPAITWTESASQNALFLMPLFEASGVDLVLCGGNSLGFTRQVNGVWYQHAGMSTGKGYFGIEVSDTALNVTHYLKDGSANSTYQIQAMPSGNLAPVADAAATPTTGDFPLTVTFDATGSTDSDGTIVSYAWTFGDGGTASIAEPSHEYTAAGTYNAVVTVTDDDGATDVDAVTITVTDPTPPPPTAATIEIQAAADTYAYSAQPTTNFGTDTGLVIRDTTQDRVSYILFDLVGIPANVTVTSAVLHLYPVTGSSPLPVKVHQVNDAWDELTMTWNTRPTPGTLLGTMNVLAANVYHQLDLTSHVQALYAADADLNLALLDDTVANILVRFASRNNAVNRPKLVVTYTVTNPPPPPPDPAPDQYVPCPSFDTYRGCMDVPTQQPGLNGYFRTEKMGERWWVMTPEGHGFLILSVSVLNADGVDGADQAGLRYVDHAEAKYGDFPTNRPAWANATIAKLMQLGFNTIGTFSHNIQGLDEADGVTTRLPWIATLRLSNSVVIDQLVGNVWEGIGSGKFPDLYHANFVSAVNAERDTVLTAEMITDPYLVYYFIDQADELRGIEHDHNSLCWAAWVGQPTLTVASGTATNNLKAKLAADMQTKYGTIAALNAAWGTSYTSFASAGGYGTGTGFVDQDDSTSIGPTYADLDSEATAAMVADCDAFVQEILGYYATTVTTSVRAVDTNHLIASPNDASLDEAVKAFDGKFDLLWCEPMSCYDLLTTKMPLISMEFDFLTAEKDSPLSLDGSVYPVTETIGSQLKIWDTSQNHCWMDLSIGNRNRMAFFDEAGAIKNYGFLANGNEYNIDENGEDALGCWFLISSRGGGTGMISDIDPVTAPLFYRRNGFGNFGPPQTFTGVGYDTQEAKALAWQTGVRDGLRDRAANGDYPRIGANWWKWSDNGWTYTLERNNWGLVTQKDNAYDGTEATLLGADGLQGTADDEEANYGDLWTGVTETNLTVYSVAGGQIGVSGPRGVSVGGKVTISGRGMIGGTP